VADDLAEVGKEAHAGAGQDLLHRLDQRAADQIVGPDLGGHASRPERGLGRLRDDLEVGGVAVALDVVHQRPQLFRRQPEVLAADVPHAHGGDRPVDLAGIRQRDVVAGQHEDELDH
jgi:hypothetical protein